MPRLRCNCRFFNVLWGRCYRRDTQHRSWYWFQSWTMGICLLLLRTFRWRMLKISCKWFVSLHRFAWWVLLCGPIRSSRCRSFAERLCWWSWKLGLLQRGLRTHTWPLWLCCELQNFILCWRIQCRCREILLGCHRDDSFEMLPCRWWLRRQSLSLHWRRSRIWWIWVWSRSQHLYSDLLQLNKQKCSRTSSACCYCHFRRTRRSVEIRRQPRCLLPGNQRGMWTWIARWWYLHWWNLLWWWGWHSLRNMWPDLLLVNRLLCLGSTYKFHQECDWHRYSRIT